MHNKNVGWSSTPSQMVENFTTIGVVNDHVQLCVGLERVVETGHERVLDRCKNSAFRERVFNLALVVEFNLL